MIAGHVRIGDFVILSGGVAVHQFARIGEHAFVGGVIGPRRRSHSVWPGLRQSRALSQASISSAFAAAIFRARRSRRCSAPIACCFRATGVLKDRIDEVAAAFPDDPHVARLIAFLRESGDRPSVQAAREPGVIAR